MPGDSDARWWSTPAAATPTSLPALFPVPPARRWHTPPSSPPELTQRAEMRPAAGSERDALRHCRPGNCTMAGAVSSHDRAPCLRHRHRRCAGGRDPSRVTRWRWSPAARRSVARQLKEHAPRSPSVAALAEHPMHRREFGAHLTNVARAGPGIPRLHRHRHRADRVGALAEERADPGEEGPPAVRGGEGCWRRSSPTPGAPGNWCGRWRI